jgi:hypothetical protein
MRRGSRRDTARLEHHDPVGAEPGGITHGERNERRLACAGRGLKDGATFPGEHDMQRGKNLVDRKPQGEIEIGALIAITRVRPLAAC